MVTIDNVEYLTMQQVAAHFNVSYKAIQQYLKRHKEVPRHHLNKTVLVRLEDFNAYQRRARRKPITV